MSTLDHYFKRNNATKDRKTDLKVKMQDDVELHPGYFVRKRLYDKMFEHQKIGLKWLFSIHEQQKGCVLADDMGLGKTLQTIALLSSLFRYDRAKHVLIIAPTTLLINWKQEFKRWADFEMFVSVIDGGVPANKRMQLIESVQTTEGVLMMTYNLARSLQEELSTSRGREFKWDYVILDEAHKIKNQSKTTKELNKLPSHLRLAITGTPVQNNLSELWSIFNFSMQGSLLGTYATFKRIYEKPIESGRKKDATTREKVLGSKIAKSLRKIYEPYLLRRTKEEIFGIANVSNMLVAKSEDQTGVQSTLKRLPPKYDWCVWIRMNQTQIKLYEDFLQSDEVKEILANPTTCKSPLVQLNVLKKICDHPRLLTKNTFEKLIYGEDVDLDKLSNVYGIPVDKLLKESSKLIVLQQLLKMLIDEKRKILLFSTSTKMLNIIEKILDKNGIQFCRLDGQVTSNDQRERIVQRFQTDKSIPLMILTVQVGGVGLTLTQATRVIIVDPNWNPGTDSQAVDRAYRIGQKNPNVIVYRLMTCTTVEEKIYSRQVYKDSLNKQTIGKENDPARYFSSTDLYTLFETGDFNKSKVCDEFNELHGSLEDKLILEAQELNQLGLTDEQQAVLLHREKIKKLIPEIYDISEHSLVFSKTFERLNTSGVDFAYLNSEVKTAKELLLKESLQANGSENVESSKDVQSAKQRLITQQFGTEFLPLGQQFNHYREGTSKFEFKRPKPRSPVKIVSLDDDEIQFLDTQNSRIMPSLNNTQRSSSSSLSRPPSASSLNNFSRQTSSTSLNRPFFGSNQNSTSSLRSLISQHNGSNNASTSSLQSNHNSSLRRNESLISGQRGATEAVKQTENASSSSLRSQLTHDQSIDSQNAIDSSSRDSQLELTDDNSSLTSVDSNHVDVDLTRDISFSSNVAPSPIRTVQSHKKNPDLVDLSVSLNNMSVDDDQHEKDTSLNDMSYVLNSFNESVRLDDLLSSNQNLNRNNHQRKEDRDTSKKDKLNTSIIVLD